MNLYILQEPVDLDCAGVVPVCDTDYIKCETCGYYTSYPKPEKRVVRWMKGSDKICSFTWPSRLVAEVLVNDQVRQTLEGPGVEFISVQFASPHKLKEPSYGMEPLGTRMPLLPPVPLFDLWVTKWVHADRERSSLRLVRVCPACKHKVYEVEGVEERKNRWDISRKVLVEVRKPRLKEMGIFVRQRDLGSANIFRVHELPGYIFCTEVIRAIVHTRSFSNVQFVEMGWTNRGV